MAALNFSLDGKLQRYLALVGLPTLLVFAYLGLVAADGYVSRAQVMVEQDSPLGAGSGAELALGLLSVGGGATKRDVLVVQNYMSSRTMLEDLDAALGLRGHFSGAAVDWFGRLDAEASEEDFLEYYQKHLTLTIDEESMILGIEFVAYDADFAQAVTRHLVSRAEAFVNEVSRYLAREQLDFVQAEVNKAQERLKQASREMITLQRRSEVFSPEAEAEALGQILAGLEVELSKQRTQLKALSGYLNPNAPDVVSTRQRIAALEAQVEQERARLVGGRGDEQTLAGGGLNDLMLSYQDAQVDLKLATEIYQTALATLESTRLDAARKVKYLVSVDEPSRPDSAEKPRVAYWTATIFVFLNLAFFVFNLIVATIQDHRE